MVKKLMRKKKHPTKRNRGVTLVELVISMVILATLMVGIQAFSVPIFDLWNYQTFRQGASSEGRLALMKMVKEINQVRNPASVTTASANSFAFTDVNNQAITFDLSAQTLRRTAGSGAKTLATGITSLQFQYFDEDRNVVGSPATSPDETDLRIVEITITITANGKTDTFRSLAIPRNILWMIGEIT